LKIHTIKLVRKIRNPADIPSGGLREIAFVGRSNVGKSSALNCLVGRNVLSPVSKSPGRTRELLYFLINEKFLFVDLPGYGYARRSEEEKDRWRDLIEAYLAREDNPKGIVQILDIRHDPSDLDGQMISWLQESGKPTLFLLTKSDKLSRGRVSSRVKLIAQALGTDDHGNILSFSAKSGSGKKDAWGAISTLLGI
jgi:GTP-binding protein